MRRVRVNLVVALLLISILLGACKARIEKETDISLIKWVEMIVSEGTIQSSFSGKGMVFAPEEAIEKYTIYYQKEEENDIRGLYGHTFEEGEQIWEDFRSPGKVKIVQLCFSGQEATLTLLNEDMLCIRTYIPYEQMRKISYLTPVDIGFEGKTYHGSVSLIGYEIKDHQIETILNVTKADLLPGCEVSFRFFLEEKEKCMFALKEAIGHDPDGSRYVYALQPDGQFVRKYIVCGEDFSMQENGYEWTFTEIISGIENGTKIHFQIAEDDPASYLYEEFFK